MCLGYTPHSSSEGQERASLFIWLTNLGYVYNSFLLKKKKKTFKAFWFFFFFGRCLNTDMTHLFFSQESEMQRIWVMQPGSSFVQGPSAPAVTAPATQLHSWGLGELWWQALVLPFWMQEPPHPSRGTCLGWQRSQQPLLWGQAWSSQADSRPSQVPSHCRRRWLFPCLKNLPTDEIFSAVAFPSLEPTPRPYLRWGQVQGTGPLQCFLEHSCKAPVFTEEKKRRRRPTISELVPRTSPYLLWPSSGPRARRQPHRWWLGQPGESTAREGACTVPS